MSPIQTFSSKTDGAELNNDSTSVILPKSIQTRITMNSTAFRKEGSSHPAGENSKLLQVKLMMSSHENVCETVLSAMHANMTAYTAIHNTPSVS